MKTNQALAILTEGVEVTPEYLSLIEAEFPQVVKQETQLEKLFKAVSEDYDRHKDVKGFADCYLEIAYGSIFSYLALYFPLEYAKFQAYKSEFRQVDNLLKDVKIDTLYTVFYNASNSITRQVVVDIARRDGYFILAQGLVREVLRGRFAK